MTSARSYYNENDPKAAAWLRELIKGGHIAAGDVDERSIEDVAPSDLLGYTQCHFFAGIGGWSYALRLDGWSDERPVWTGSCPCQPFSQAGKGKGTADERHLWPAWFYLVEQLKPPKIFGEQVASPAGLAWLDLVSTDLEGADYAVGTADLCAAGVGAPHIRQRLFWVAESGRERLERVGLRLQSRGSQQDRSEVRRSGKARELGDSSGTRSGRDRGTLSGEEGCSERKVWSEFDEPKSTSVVGHTDNARSQGRSERRHGADKRSPWAASLVDCRDGKRRPVEPGTFPLAHGVPGRVGLLRGYGNAIVPQVAAAFIAAYEDVFAAHE